MEKLDFFGGCFNPITNAHVSLIKNVIEKENLSKVYFVPMGDFYCKENLIPLNYRIEMIKLAIQDERKMDILDISNKKYKMSAIDSFRIIDKQFENYERFFIMGSDNYKKIHTWKESEELLHNYKYIVLDRENGIAKEISASLVREKIKCNEKLNELIPLSVMQYIKNNNLYE